MKRWIVILLCLVLVFAMIGCGNSISPGKPGSNQPAETDTQNQQNIDSQETQAPEPLSEPNSDSMPSDSMDGVDVDLTVLSSTMVYSEVYNMLASPDQYIGKTVKMDGLFTYYYDKPTGNYYFACIIQDATACCAQGIEFVLTDEYTYPDDYPEADAEICVVGVFDTYEEKGDTYCTLREAKLL